MNDEVVVYGAVRDGVVGAEKGWAAVRRAVVLWMMPTSQNRDMGHPGVSGVLRADAGFAVLECCHSCGRVCARPRTRRRKHVCFRYAAAFCAGARHALDFHGEFFGSAGERLGDYSVASSFLLG